MRVPAALIAAIDGPLAGVDARGVTDNERD
jgi:hypothetical protein